MATEARSVCTAPASSLDCVLCPRLAQFLDDARREYPHYHARPVPSFGPPGSRLLLVGLAPGLHGANATGRPFTGDFAGRLLYSTLHRFGFATHPVSVSASDELRLVGCRITNAVRCVPPQNKPTPAEVRTCNAWLRDEIAAVPAAGVLIALGAIAHGAIVQALGLRASSCRFAHGATHALPGERVLVDSYHCSRYNTQTRRLTEAMFHDIFSRTEQLLRR
jgi:uracil-DNA glycosylase